MDHGFNPRFQTQNICNVNPSIQIVELCIYLKVIESICGEA